MQLIKKALMQLVTYTISQNIQSVMIGKQLEQHLSLMLLKEGAKQQHFKKSKNGNFLVNNFFRWMLCLTLYFYYLNMIQNIKFECH